MPTRSPHLPDTTLGGRIRRAREAAGLTREELATAVDRTFNAIVGYEHDRLTPRLVVLLAIARACDTTAADLLDGVERVDEGAA